VTAVLEHYAAQGRSIPAQFPAELRAEVRKAFVSALSPIDGVNTVLEGLQIPHCVASRAMSIGCPSRFPDRPRAAFRHPSLYFANGGTRQAGARSLSVRGQKGCGPIRVAPLSLRIASAVWRQPKAGRHDCLGICRGSTINRVIGKAILLARGPIASLSE